MLFFSQGGMSGALDPANNPRGLADLARGDLAWLRAFLSGRRTRGTWRSRLSYRFFGAARPCSTRGSSSGSLRLHAVEPRVRGIAQPSWRR